MQTGLCWGKFREQEDAREENENTKDATQTVEGGLGWGSRKEESQRVQDWLELRRREVMVEIICDNCGARKKSDREWILGSRQQKKSLRTGSLRTLIRFFDRWYTRLVSQPGAIHLCSTECKEKYARNNGLRIIITQRDQGLHSY